MPEEVAPPGCPTDDVLSALVDRALSADELADVTAHLDDCQACREVVIAALRAGSSLATTTAVAAVRSGAPARRIGRYVVRHLLGIGGMGAVYEAHDGELDRAVALKVLRPTQHGDLAALADRLVRESRLMAKVVHPAVITVYDVGRDGDSVFIAMELIRGHTLASYLASPAGKQLDWRAVVALFERAGHGLAAAHAAGIVHRDFKPDNVLVEGDARRVVVSDFGVARSALGLAAGSTPAAAAASGGDPRLTQSGATVGTPAYAAPEQLSARPLDHRADVFAFCVSLWEAVFGARPFPGKTVAELRLAMREPPVRPAGASVPGRLVRALSKGLALAPEDRWHDMQALLAELSALRARRRRFAFTAGATGALGLAALAIVATRPAPAEDPCERALARFAEAYSTAHQAQVAGALASDPPAADTVIDKLAKASAAWAAVQRASCRADRVPVQDTAIAACLEARRIELAGFVDDVVSDGAAAARHAVKLSELVSDPAACATPPPGLLFARLPADRDLRRAVTALRKRGFDTTDELGRGDTAAARAAAEQLVTDARAVWPPVHAEALHLLGTVQTASGDARLGNESQRQAAALAERVHHDDVVARSWVQLVISALTDDTDPVRASEYLTFAEAAADRVARPRAVMMKLHYARAGVLTLSDRNHEAELAFRKAAELAEAERSDFLSVVMQGLAFVYESMGRYRDAVAACRHALALRLAGAAAGAPGSANVRLLLSGTLRMIGEIDEAEREARAGIAIRERTQQHGKVAAANVYLAQVLAFASRYAEALEVNRRGLEGVAAALGQRHIAYSQRLQVHGEVLTRMEHHVEAESVLARACEIMAFTTGEDSAAYVNCKVQHAAALIGVRRPAEALAVLERAEPVLSAAYPPPHPVIGELLQYRGRAHAALGHHAAAVADFEAMIAIASVAQIEPGLHAMGRWLLGRQLWPRDRTRARAEIEGAIGLFERAVPMWRKDHDRARSWLAQRPNR